MPDDEPEPPGPAAGRAHAPPGSRGRRNKESTFDRDRARKRMMRRIVAVLAVTLVVAGTAAALMNLRPPAGGPNTSLHQHPSIAIFVNGAQVDVPVNIGIDPNLWKDHSMDEYQEMESMSPIHTHDGSGLIHLEMGKWHACTLGDFFNVWGQPFDRDHLLSSVGPVTMTVNGSPNDEYRNLVLQDGQQIVVRVG